MSGSPAQLIEFKGQMPLLEGTQLGTSYSVTHKQRHRLRKIRCTRCHKEVTECDEEFQQCVRCNADELHESARLTIFETLPLERSRRFALTEQEWDLRRDREQPGDRRRKETFA